MACYTASDGPLMLEFVPSELRLTHTCYESGCDDWRRGTDLSWIMGAECLCFTFVLHVAGCWWALTWDSCLKSEPALHSVILGHWSRSGIVREERDRTLLHPPLSAAHRVHSVPGRTEVILKKRIYPPPVILNTGNESDLPVKLEMYICVVWEEGVEAPKVL